MKLSISMVVSLCLIIMTIVGHSMADDHHQASGSTGRVGSSGQRKPLRQRPTGLLGGGTGLLGGGNGVLLGGILLG